jgi:hypothetical protein
MTVKTKKKKKKLSKTKRPVGPLNFRQLLGLVTRHEHGPTLIKATYQSGWLSDESFVAKLSENEMEQIRSLYLSDSKYRQAKIGDVDPMKVLPEMVGPFIDDQRVSGRLARLSNGTHTVFVDATLFLTMKKRYPEASVHLSNVAPDTGPVTFSEQNTVAVLPTIRK